MIRARRFPSRLAVTAAVGWLALSLPGRAPAQTPPPPAPALSRADAPAPALPLRLALHAETAFGVATGAFRNHLLGARLDLGFSPRVSLGAALAYADLKGKDGRAHAALVAAQLEYLAGDLNARVRYPLRFSSGYLGGNGPIARVAAGLALALTPTTDLVTELLAPMIWFTNNQMLLSMNLSLELCIRL